jgi:hypothetical protein
MRRSLRSIALLVPLAVATVYADDEFQGTPTWQPVSTGAVRAQLEEYLDEAGIPTRKQADVRDAWRSTDVAAQSDLLDRLAGALSKSDQRVQELIEYCTGASKPGKLPEFAWLADSETPLLVRHNMRLYLARWLIQQGYYDEGLAWTDGLMTEDVVAPDALLFYRAVALHQLVQPDRADAALSRLLERQAEVPTRYQKLADLMRQDLSGLQDDSLDHISRRMVDVRRRLAQGRSGERVQSVENGVIESLDKLIKKLEDQMQQSQCNSGAAGGQPSGTPMQDSQIAELKAPGKIDQKDIGRGAGWGNVPDKDREKALQEIGREFPSHYREVIEEYFRRLASEESAKQP